MSPAATGAPLGSAKPRRASTGPSPQAEPGQQQQQQQAQKVQMKRTLGLWNGIAIIVGVIVGSGIFISPRGVLVHAGSPGASLLVWCLCGLLALLGALCFAELGTSIASSGGEYTYIRLAYGPLPSFLYIWVLALVVMPCSNAISALTFANYCLQPLFEANYRPPEEAVRLLALAILMLLIYINCTTVTGSIRLQGSFTLAKVFALALIIGYGCYYLLAGNPFRSVTSGRDGPPAPPPIAEGDTDAAADADAGHSTGWWADTQANLPQLARAFYSGFFTYSGWSTLNCVTEEIREPVKNIPRAIVLSITSVTLIYILTNTAYFAVLSKSEILGSDAIAVLFGQHAFSSLARWLMPLAVALSTMGGLNASIFAASRIYFAAARQGQLFGALETIHLKHLTPVASLLFLGATSALYLCTTEIGFLIEYMTFVEASFAALGVSTVLAMRLKLPDLERPLRVPLLVPCVYLAFSAAMLLLPLWSSPAEALIGMGITLTGLPVYFLTARWEPKPRSYRRAIDALNKLTQKLTYSVVPARDEALLVGGLH